MPLTFLEDFPVTRPIPSGFEEFYAQVAERIKNNQWTVVSTAVEAELPGEYTHTSLSYTVGLQSQGLPELITYGLPESVAHHALNQLAKRLIAKQLQLDTPIEQILARHLVILKAVDPNKVRGIFGLVRDFAPDPENIVLWQAVWPDPANGKFPWEAGYGDPLRQIQPERWSLLH